MKFSAQLHKDAASDLYHWYFPIPKDIAQALIEGNDRRVITTVNSVVKYHCSIHGGGTGEYRIMLNKERCKKLGLVSGQTISVDVEKDNSEYGVPIGDELREVLDQFPDAEQIFHSFTKGMQRTLIYWVNNVKSSDIKIRRAIVMSNHLVKQGGKPDFKLLNLEMKDANQAAKRS